MVYGSVGAPSVVWQDSCLYREEDPARKRSAPAQDRLSSANINALQQLSQTSRGTSSFIVDDRLPPILQNFQSTLMERVADEELSRRGSQIIAGKSLSLEKAFIHTAMYESEPN